jgi:excisionase family DNA binding protein
MTAVEPVMLTPAEVADALRLGKTKTYALIGSGAIPSVRIGAARRVPKPLFDAYVQHLIDAQT